MATLKALLVGVNDYSNLRPTKVRKQGPLAKGAKPFKTVLVDADLPSAQQDVRNMRKLLTDLTHASSLPYQSIEAVALSGAADTTGQSIRNWLAWLGDSAGAGDQLLLYFSGHSAWARNVAIRRATQGSSADACRPHAGRASRRTEVLVTGLEVALCPSDTTWDDLFLTSGDLLQLMWGAFTGKACLEIVLETCSASGIDLSLKGVPRRYFGEGTLPPRTYARWDAAQLDESSHSAPVPACTGDIQGLFTHCFAREVRAGGSRAEVLSRVKTALKQYWVDRKACRCKDDPLHPYKQTPHLSGASGAAPFSSTCLGQPEAPSGAPAKDVNWIYAS